MKILLTVAPFWNEPDAAAPRHIVSCAPLAPYLLASILKGYGHDVDVLDPSRLEPMLDGGEFVTRFLKYDVVGISSTSGAWPNARRILDAMSTVKNRPKIVLGGPHPTAFPEHILSTTVADAVIIGEGDKCLPKVVDAFAAGQSLSNINGIAGRDFVNPAGTLLTADELGALPDPDFSTVPDEYYDVLPVETSRGCPNQCVFCSVKFGKGIREMSGDAAARRVSHAGKFVGRSSKKALFAVDDCFTASAERVKPVAQAAREQNLRMAIEARIEDILDDEIFEAVRELNPVKIEIGVECGYEEGLRRIGKGIRLDQIIACGARLQANGLADRARFSFVMGLPWEGHREVTATMKFAAELSARSGGHIQLNWFTCYPRSPIYRDAKRWGIDLTPADYDKPFWWKSPDLFDRTHPKFKSGDAIKTLSYLELLKKLHPRVVFEGLIGVKK